MEVVASKVKRYSKVTPVSRFGKLFLRQKTEVCPFTTNSTTETPSGRWKFGTETTTTETRRSFQKSKRHLINRINILLYDYH